MTRPRTGQELKERKSEELTKRERMRMAYPERPGEEACRAHTEQNTDATDFVTTEVEVDAEQRQVQQDVLPGVDDLGSVVDSRGVLLHLSLAETCYARQHPREESPSIAANVPIE